MQETIAFDDINGKIIRFANRNLILEKQNHSIIEIPYNKFFSVKIERHMQSIEEELSLEFEHKNIKNLGNYKSEIKKQVLELPWINHKHETKINFKKLDENKTKVELKIILLDKKYRDRVESLLTKSFEK